MLTFLCEEGKYEAAVQGDGLAADEVALRARQVTRAQAYHGLGRYRESLADLEHVIAFGPGGFTPGEQAYYHALNQRAWLRATCPDPAFRNAERALADAKIACTATLWKNSSYLETIAAAYANAGDFPNAIRIRSARSRLGVSARRRPAMCFRVCGTGALIVS